MIGIVELVHQENHTVEPKKMTLSYTQPELWQFKDFPIEMAVGDWKNQKVVNMRDCRVANKEVYIRAYGEMKPLNGLSSFILGGRYP